MPSPKELAKALAYRGEIRNTPQNSFLGGIANFLAPVSEFADRDKLPESIPLLGGMSFADLSGLKGTESLVRDMSYGKSPVRGATLNTAKVDPRLLDLAAVSGAMIPVGKAALREAAKQIQNKTGFAKFMPDTRMGVVPEGKAMSVPKDWTETFKKHGGQGDIDESLDIAAKSQAFADMAEAEGFKVIGRGDKYVTLNKSFGKTTDGWDKDAIVKVRISDHSNVNRSTHFGEADINIAPDDGYSRDTFADALEKLRTVNVSDDLDTVFTKAMSAPAKAMNDGSQDVITYIGRKGQKFQITKQRDNELLDIHSSIADKAREIFGDGVESFDSGMSSSRYVKLPNGAKIRVSDHPLPSDFAAMHGVPDVEVRGGQDLQKAIDYMIDAKSNKTMPNSQKRYDDLSLRDELRSNGVPLFAVDARQIRKLVNSGVGYDDIANQLQQKYPKLTDSDAAKIYTVIGRGKFDKFDVPVKDQIVRYGDNVGGAMMQRPKTEFEILHDTAQRNAALPVEQGGLGLPSGNTAMDRAGAMGFDTPAYHGTNRALTEFSLTKAGDKTGNPNSSLGVFSTPNTDEASRYASNWGTDGGNVIPLLVRGGNTYQMPYKELDDHAMLPYRLLQQDPSYDANSVIKFGDMAGQREAASRLSKAEELAQIEVQKRRSFLQSEGYDSAIVSPGKKMEERIVFDPANIRSRFAAFDPMRRHEADILAGVGVGGMLDPQAIAEALRQQDRK